jgi:outer membrane lipoprotein SlyB
MSTPRFIRAELWLASALFAIPAFAADTPAAAPAHKPAAAESNARLCATCGRVSSVKTEQRKGKASGVGAVGGAVAGGVLGHQMGGGSGKTLTTVGGAAAGALLGNELEKQTKKHTVWITTVKMKDGSHKTFESEANPGLKLGDVVTVENGQMKRHAH